MTPAQLDRLSQRKRPQEKPAGYQRWSSLLFLHWEIPAAVLRALVPEPLELDTFEGRAFVGLVPFAMDGVRPWWAPKWTAFSFLETNVRTYVHINGEPGVYFFSLEAASWIATQTARMGWGLPYYFADMHTETKDGVTHYKSMRRDKSCAELDVRYTVDATPPAASVEGTLDDFFLERYLLFVKRGNTILRGQVHHTPYPATTAKVISIFDRILEVGGCKPAQEMPDYAHYSPGVDVEVFALRPVQKK
jgi:uncharacterized protein YqjF (DUF2071 family)